MLKDIEVHYVYLRDHVTPRVVARPHDPTLTKLLFDLESKELDWQNAVRSFPDDLAYPVAAAFTWRAAIGF